MASKRHDVSIKKGYNHPIVGIFNVYMNVLQEREVSVAPVVVRAGGRVHASSSSEIELIAVAAKRWFRRSCRRSRICKLRM